MSDWPAPLASAPVRARVALPGSKSVTNRALVLAALADGTSRLRRPLVSRDTRLMTEGLRALGVVIDDLAGDWEVHGRGTPLPTHGAARVDVGNAGTVMRFLPPLAGLGNGTVEFDGDPRARERPLGPLLTGLVALGADLDDGGRGRLPMVVCGHGHLPGGAVDLDASSSSQLVSGLLLAAPRYDAGIRLRHVGPPMPSAPHVVMTVAMLRERGANVSDDAADAWSVEPGPLAAGDWEIEPDLSNAAPFLAAAMVTGGRVLVPRWPAHSTQPGVLLPALLEQMGARCVLTPQGLEVTGSSPVLGTDVDLRACGELAPVLTAVAALATTPSRLRGIGHLRLHETDRLAALARELNRLGGDVRVHDDGLEVRPAPLRSGRFATYDDHRLATAAAVLGLVVPGVVVENIETTAKTMPEFARLWQAALDERPEAAGDGAGSEGTGGGPP